LFNIKKLRKATQRTVDLIYWLGLDTFFCKILTIIPLSSLLNNFWINDYRYYEKSFHSFNKILQENDIACKDKKILEIGSGNSIGWGYFFKGEGCDIYIASDKYRSTKMSKRALKMEKQIVEQAQKLYPNLNLDELIEINHKEIILKTTQLQFEKLDMTQDQITFNNKFDLIISNAVLEHISKKDLSKAIENMNMLLKKGGIMVHAIDLRDHFNMNFPFNFYKYSEYEWNKLVCKTQFYTNRLRLMDYIDQLKKNNFEIIYIKKDVLKGSTKRIKIHSEFRNKYDIDDLETMSCKLIVRKNICVAMGR